ncbi:hypothetical protein [Streptomyces mesophilus]|uniref:hypothetical protein n=1 Tax=Streptomyces mesophilus TaxID=1775132 RepID=UPI0013EACB17|nr:hypothetical protein [Streptomyces mesophilus]
MPGWWATDGHRRCAWNGPSNRGTWLDTAYSNRTLVTRVSPVRGWLRRSGP